MPHYPFAFHSWRDNYDHDHYDSVTVAGDIWWNTISAP
jgi:hypothetical protein